MKQIIYLDNSATTFPKPVSVISEVETCLKKYCGNPLRGNHMPAMKSTRLIYECRCMLADMFGANAENVIFTYNTTYAINMALKGVLFEGDHVLISDMEHNAVLRPVDKLARQGLIEYDIFSSYGKTTDEIIADIDLKVKQNTKALCCLHSSNICSHTLPIKEIGKYCHDNGIIFICDGAQSGGHIPINMKECHIDILCLPFHKGLYGPQGGGIMILSDNISINTLIEGGNGISAPAADIIDTGMGDNSPEKYEAGTLNTPGIAGLIEGLKFVNYRGIDSIEAQNRLLFNYARDRLSAIKTVRIYDTTPGSVLLFGVEDMDSDEVGELLSRRGICVRCGYHCAPLAHRTIGTSECGGVRVSFGAFNTPRDIMSLCYAIEDISSRNFNIKK